MWESETLEYGSVWTGRPVKRRYYNGRRWMVRYLFDIGRQDPIEPVMTAQQAREEVESRILARAAANVGDKTTKQLKMEQIEAIISTRGEASAKQLALEIDLTRRTIAQYLQIDRRFCVGRVGPRGEKFYILRRAA